MRAIDGDALEKYLSDAEIEAIKQRRYVFASALNTICGNVRNFPTIEPERKKGRWVYNSPVTMKCNQCGLVIKDWDWHRFKYCPNCISDMRGE